MKRKNTNSGMLCLAMLATTGMGFAQWSQNTTAGPSLYTDSANWTGGNISGQFTAAPITGLNVTWDADHTLASGINLSYTGTQNVTFSSDSATLRTIIMSGDWTRSSNTGTVTIGNTANPLALNLGGATRSFGGSGTTVVNAGISGAGGMIATGGTLTLAGTNSYTGLTKVNPGATLNVNGNHTSAQGGFNATNSGGSVMNFNAGSEIQVSSANSINFANNSGSSATANLNVAGTVTNQGSLSLGRGGNLVLNNGALWNQSGAMSLATSANTFMGVSLQINSGATMTYSGSSAIGLNSSAGGGGGGANFTVNGGTFVTGQGFVNSSSGSASTANVTLQNAGTLRLSASVAQLGQSTGATPRPLNYTIGTGGGKIDTQEFNGSLASVISGSGSLEKLGTGSLTLAGASSGYTGSVAVSAGTLFVNGALGSSVTASNGALVGGTGVISGSLTLNAGALFHVANVNDPLAVIGSVNLGSGFGIASLRGIDWDSLSNGEYTLISDTTTVFADANINNFGLANAIPVGSYDKMAYFTNGSLRMVMVPEPSAALLGTLGAFALLRRRRCA